MARSAERTKRTTRPRDAQADGVLRDIAAGFKDDEAAARNGCSERTVRTIKSEYQARLHELRLKYADTSALKLLRDIVDGVTPAPIRERVQAANILLKFPVLPDEQDDPDGSRTVVGGEIHVHFGDEHRQPRTTADVQPTEKTEKTADITPTGNADPRTWTE